MKFVDDLLQGDKVEWLPLGEVGTFTRGSALQKKDFTSTGVACIHYGQIYTHYGTHTHKTKSFVSHEFAQKARKAQHGALVIATTSENDEDVCKAVAWLGKEDVVISSDACFYTHTLAAKYVAYYFQTKQFQKQKRSFITGTKVRRVNATDLAKIRIPLPPLSVQHKLVECLDKFTALETELYVKLATELSLRKQQYEYYLHTLLSTEELSKAGHGVVWLSLGEVFETRNGYTPSKANKELWEGGTIPWFRMEDIRQNGGILSNAIQHITPQAVKGKGLFKANSIILATTATIGKHALITSDYLANQQFTNFSTRPSWEDKLLPKFIYYYFFLIGEWCKQHVNVSSFPSVKIEKLKEHPFPIPPLAEQQRIVDTLDKLSTLTASISDSLSNERILRQRQYEYYRDHLFSFT